MKIKFTTPLIATALSLTVFTSLGCAKKAPPDESTMPTAKELNPAAAPIAPGMKTIEPRATAHDAAMASPDPASATWVGIKDAAYAESAAFFTGFVQLEAQVDAQLSALTAKRAAMKSDVSTADWDFAMKEMNDSRSYLKSVGEELKKASAETWVQQKETVGLAWQRTQAAYDKVVSSTTK